VNERRKMSDDALADELATWAGRLLIETRKSALLSGAAMDAAGRAIAQELIVCALAAARPQQAVLAKGLPDDRARLAHRAVWIIDPLDGTREFAQGRDDFAVHVALVLNGEPTIGAVALPALGVTYSTAETIQLDETPRQPFRIVINRTRRLAFFAEQVADALDAELVTMGSMGAKTMAVLRGEVDAYVCAIGQHEWESAAPVAVARHAGLHVSRLDGSPLRFNQPDTFQPDFLACRPELAPRLLAAVAEVLQAAD
jgi:3'(2'), 5'-bisphosphate nucleotidase